MYSETLPTDPQVILVDRGPYHESSAYESGGFVDDGDDEDDERDDASDYDRRFEKVQVRISRLSL